MVLLAMVAFDVPGFPGWIETVLVVLASFTAVALGVGGAVRGIWVILRQCLAVQETWHALRHPDRSSFLRTMLPDDGWQRSPSSAIEAYRFLAGDDILQLVFVDGQMVYDYPCTQPLYENFLRAPSKGRFVNETLKPYAELLGWSPRPRHWDR